MADAGKSTLPVDLLRQIDALCAEFERAWKGDESPPIEDYVPRVPEQARPTALQELIAQEVDLRRAAGESVEPAEYHERFPEDAAEVDAAFELVVGRHGLGLATTETDPYIPKSEQGTEDEPDRGQVADEEEPFPEQIGRYKIITVLGKGGFGVVYLAEDTELNRRVALKRPLASRFSSPEELDRFIEEARTAAQLEHPGIVPVHDVFREGDRGVIVQKYVEGGNLRSHLKSGAWPPDRAAELAVRIAGALAFAHQKDFVHRDLKPRNILLDAEGQPHIADFGLAVHESVQRRRRGERAGTPAYMSPEQVRGETHRLDGRTDIWSLGVILYEMLTGRRPFSGEPQSELFDEVKYREPKPPSQIDPRLPAELERICLKCLSKRATDRYPNAAALAEDLRHWLSAKPEEAPPAPESRLAKIVPKGLRSFGPEDADFFLELLPGPRDRDGLPESIRFWKTRIEETDPDNTFAVGLIYGPSGCGKSSLLRAGLLPRLASHVVPICIEATPADTEVRLLKALRRRFPEIPSDISLPELFESLRQSLWIPAGQKVLIVLDQFEQWLHARRAEPDTQLQQALRHCDAERVQCLCLVRDDFWVATSRFMQALEVELLEGRNTALVDLFDPLHACNVLAEFGRAYGRLPDNLGELTADQEAFLDRAVEGLARDGKVICVRLALFADMVEGKPWSTTTLKQVGGTEGLGVTFLEETFSASTAPAQNRYHQKAAQAILKALLPEAGTDIKGGMRSREELLQSSGYARRPRDFENLIRILDSEIRLITPTDPEGSGADDVRIAPPLPSGEGQGEGAEYYQLTHDYLVPSLREWLTRKQKETRRGRAELRLAERATLWNAKPENRRLPSLWEWLNIRSLTRRRDRTESQRKMLRKADTYHVVRGLLVLALLLLAVWASYQAFGRLRGEALARALASADTEQVPQIVEEIGTYRAWADPLLAKILDKSEENSRERLHASLALVPVDPQQVNYLYARLLRAEADQFPVVRDALLGHKIELAKRLWKVSEEGAQDKDRRFRAACALAAYAPDDARWTMVSKEVADYLVSVSPTVLRQWMDALRPVRGKLVPSLTGIFRDANRGETERSLATDVLADYASDAPAVLVDLANDADDKQFSVLFPKLQAHGDRAIALLESELDQEASIVAEQMKEHLAKRQANAAVALLRLGRSEGVWPLFAHSPDPRLRTYLIHRMARLGCDPQAVLKRLEKEDEVSIRRALILSLGEFGDGDLSIQQRTPWIQKLVDTYRNDPDPGIHAAAEWLLRQWDQGDLLRQVDKELATGKVEGDRGWYITGQGQTMVIIPGPVEFTMGSPASEPNRMHDEVLHNRRIGRSFAMASKEITVEQFQSFSEDTGLELNYVEECSPERDGPQIGVPWYYAAAYCNWLSQKEGFPEGQWCYVPSEPGEFREGMRIASDYLGRTGYRLPTEAEWEYACRAGTATKYCYGESEETVGKYAWHVANSQDRAWPGGTLKPNDYGLFDMHGNAWEWCQECRRHYPWNAVLVPSEDTDETQLVVLDQDRRVLRGGAFINRPCDLSSAFRYSFPLSASLLDTGFRVARTYR